MAATRAKARGTRARRPASTAALENARLAAATGASAQELVATALASLPERSVRETLAALRAIEAELDGLAKRGAPAVARRPAALGPDLEFEPELARVRPEIHDHEIRGKLLFKELLGRRTFFQVAAWSIAGLELSVRDAHLLEQLGVNTQLLDPHIWPLAVARRVASQGAPLARVLVAGAAALFTKGITVQPVAAFMRFLDEAELARRGGATVEAFVEGELVRGRRIAGFGRPVLGPDERVPHALRLARRHGRAGGASVRLARSVERTLRASKGLVINSAGFQAAIMRDMGFTPDGAAAFCALYFLVPLLAQYAFVAERGPASSR